MDGINMKEVKAEKKLPVIELYGPVVQGEGALIGAQTHFVRFGGCDFSCGYKKDDPHDKPSGKFVCDSLQAVFPEEIKKYVEYMTADHIFESVCDLGIQTEWITLSGGNPLLWDLKRLVLLLRYGSEEYESNQKNTEVVKFKVAVETQGTIWKDWLYDCDLVTVSPKPPSSCMETNYEDLTRMCTNLSKQEQIGRTRNYSITAGNAILKVVVFTNEDYDYAKKIHQLFPWIPFYLQTGTTLNSNMYFNSNPELDSDTTGEKPNPSFTSDSEDILRARTRNDILHRLKYFWEKTVQDPDMKGVRILPQLHSLVFGEKLGV